MLGDIDHLFGKIGHTYLCYFIRIIDLKNDTISKTVNMQDSISEMNIDPITGTIFMLNTAGNKIYLTYGFIGQFADTRHHYKKPSSNRSMSVVKIVEIVGSSDKGWEEAAQVAVEEAMKTLRGIRGIEVADQTALVDPRTGRPGMKKWYGAQNLD